MGTYIMLSTLTDEGAKTIKANPQRIKEVNSEVEKLGVKILAQYAVMGPYDFLTVIEAPDNETIARVSLELSSRGSVKIMTLAAIPIDESVKRLEEYLPALGMVGRGGGMRGSMRGGRRGGWRGQSRQIRQ